MLMLHGKLSAWNDTEALTKTESAGDVKAGLVTPYSVLAQIASRKITDITIEEIRQWLEGRKPNDLVGVSQSDTGNLLAHFLIDTANVQVDRVGMRVFSVASKTHPIPTEVADFLNISDRLPEFSGIRAEVTIRVLKGDFEGLPVRYSCPSFSCYFSLRF